MQVSYLYFPLPIKLNSRRDTMVRINIEQLLKEKGKTKYWLCQKMNLTSRNLNRIIRGETISISFRYIEDFCIYLDCTPSDLMTIIPKEKTNIFS